MPRVTMKIRCFSLIFHGSMLLGVRTQSELEAHPKVGASSGESMLTQTIQFDEPVHNPVIALWSVGFGSLGQTMTIDFDTAPTLLSLGTSQCFLPPDFSVAGTRASGIEGNGVLQLEGDFTAFSFTVPALEIGGYAGFTVGIHVSN